MSRWNRRKDIDQPGRGNPPTNSKVMVSFYEIILYKDGQLWDYFDRVDSYTKGVENAKIKSKGYPHDEVALAKEVGDGEEMSREWTKFYKNGKLIRTEKWK